MADLVLPPDVMNIILGDLLMSGDLVWAFNPDNGFPTLAWARDYEPRWDDELLNHWLMPRIPAPNHDYVANIDGHGSEIFKKRFVDDEDAARISAARAYWYWLQNNMYVNTNDLEPATARLSLQY